MHQLNVLVLGPNKFVTTLIELKPYLKFNLFKDIDNSNNNSTNFDIVLFHENNLKNQQEKNFILKSNLIKIFASNKGIKKNIYDETLLLPTSLNEINSIIENSAAKKIFAKNSSIKIKNFFLDKNEKKLIKGQKFIILTEKEIQLLEIFLNHKEPISKNRVLELVWNYSTDADTHTVETHIYRLRKKINDEFSDDQFILNSKDGYHI